MPPPPPGATPPPFLSDQSVPTYLYLTLVTVFIYVGFICCCLRLRRLRQNIPIDDVEEQRNHPQQPQPPPNYNPNQATAAQPPPPEKKESSLFPYTKNQTIATNTGSDSECSICLDEFKDGDICRLLIECKHAFHGDCIDQWLLKEEKIHCPLCRATLSGVQL